MDTTISQMTTFAGVNEKSKNRQNTQSTRGNNSPYDLAHGLESTEVFLEKAIYLCSALILALVLFGMSLKLISLGNIALILIHVFYLRSKVLRGIELRKNRGKKR